MRSKRGEEETIDSQGKRRRRKDRYRGKETGQKTRGQIGKETGQKTRGQITRSADGH